MQCRKCFGLYEPSKDNEDPIYTACPHVISGDAVFFERGGSRGIDTLYCKTCALVLGQRFANDKDGQFAGGNDWKAEVGMVRPVCKPDWDVLRKQRIN